MMTHTTDLTTLDQTNPVPEDTPEPCGTNPVYQAAATVQHWLKPLDENLKLEHLAVEMEGALMFEDIDNINDSAVMMSTHMRVLDTVFNQFLRQGMKYGAYQSPDYEKIGFALLAQRQCANAFDKLNRRRRPRASSER